MKQRLLLVDDEPGIVETMKAYFAPQYEILTACNGQEAIRKAGLRPDLILLDINMPEMDGLTVCRTIREHIACPILFLTARVESADQIAGFQAGADDYIIKPFDLAELSARVDAHLRREQRRQGQTVVRFLESWRWITPPGRSRSRGGRCPFPGGSSIFWSFFP